METHSYELVSFNNLHKRNERKKLKEWEIKIKYSF